MAYGGGWNVRRRAAASFTRFARTHVSFKSSFNKRRRSVNAHRTRYRIVKRVGVRVSSHRVRHSLLRFCRGFLLAANAVSIIKRRVGGFRHSRGNLSCCFARVAARRRKRITEKRNIESVTATGE